MKNCKHCGHGYEFHASDHNHPDTEPCWHGAVSGDGCDCKQYVNPLDSEGKR